MNKKLNMTLFFFAKCLVFSVAVISCLCSMHMAESTYIIQQAVPVQQSRECGLHAIVNGMNMMAEGSVRMSYKKACTQLAKLRGNKGKNNVTESEIALLLAFNGYKSSVPLEKSVLYYGARHAIFCESIIEPGTQFEELNFRRSVRKDVNHMLKQARECLRAGKAFLVILGKSDHWVAIALRPVNNEICRTIFADSLAGSTCINHKDIEVVDQLFRHRTLCTVANTTHNAEAIDLHDEDINLKFFKGIKRPISKISDKVVPQDCAKRIKSVKDQPACTFSTVSTSSIDPQVYCESVPKYSATYPLNPIDLEIRKQPLSKLWFDAIEQGNADDVQILLEKNIIDINQHRESDNQNALMIALDHYIADSTSNARCLIMHYLLTSEDLVLEENMVIKLQIAFSILSNPLFLQCIAQQRTAK